MIDMSELFLTGAFFLVVYLFCRWLERVWTPGCRCDQSNQGRECPNCQHYAGKEEV